MADIGENKNRKSRKRKQLNLKSDTDTMLERKMTSSSPSR